MPAIRRLCAALALTLLAACQMQAPGKAVAPTDVAPLNTDAIAVTPLETPAVTATPIGPPAVATKPADAPPPVQTADKTTPHPKPRPSDASPPAPEAPPPISPEQALCQKTGGDWSPMGQSSGHLCVHRTRDSGKACSRKSDCQGECLAQSGTCSPITPLVGCNDVLQANGSRVTLCLQ